MRWFVVLLLSVGCRQLLGIEGAEIGDAGGSDSGSAGDGPSEAIVVIGHDEDGDLVGDAADNCPTIANLDQVTTGDEVGAACDPRGALGGDRVAAFHSFFPAGQPSQVMSNATFENDRATMDSGEIATKDQVKPTRFAITFSQTMLPTGTAYIELTVGTHRCRIGNCMGSGTYCLLATGNSAQSESDVLLDTEFRFELDQLADKVVCRLSTQGSLETMTQADATSIETDRARVRVQGVTAHVDSFIVYDTP